MIRPNIIFPQRWSLWVRKFHIHCNEIQVQVEWRRIVSLQLHFRAYFWYFKFGMLKFQPKCPSFWIRFSFVCRSVSECYLSKHVPWKICMEVNNILSIQNRVHALAIFISMHLHKWNRFVCVDCFILELAFLSMHIYAHRNRLLWKFFVGEKKLGYNEIA